MAKTIFGLLRSRGEADHVIDELRDYGYESEDISVIAMESGNTDFVYDDDDYVEDRGSAFGSSTATGVAGGAVLGGLAGLLIGVGAIAIPGIGALLIAGPISAALGLTGVAATTVSGALTGALAGGIIGALVGLGVPEQDARFYEERIKEGGVLIAVPVTDMQAGDVKDILDEHGADNIREVEMDKAIEEEEYRAPGYQHSHYVGTKGGKTSKLRRRG